MVVGIKDCRLYVMARQDFLPPFWDMGFGESASILLTMFEDDCYQLGLQIVIRSICA